MSFLHSLVNNYAHRRFLVSTSHNNFILFTFYLLPLFCNLLFPIQYTYTENAPRAPSTVELWTKLNTTVLKHIPPGPEMRFLINL